MPDPDEWATALIEKAKELGVDVIAVVTGPFSFDELVQVIRALVNAAELVFDGPGHGVEKKEAVQAVIQKLKDEYGLVDLIDNLIPLPFPFELFDGKIIDMLLDILIEYTVKLLNLLGAWQ